MWQIYVFGGLLLGLFLAHQIYYQRRRGFKVKLTQSARQLSGNQDGETLTVRVPCVIENYTGWNKSVTLAELVVDGHAYRLRDCDVVKLEDRVVSLSDPEDELESNTRKRGLTGPVVLHGISYYDFTFYFELPESLRGRDIEAILSITAGMCTVKKRLVIESPRTVAARSASLA